MGMIIDHYIRIVIESGGNIPTREQMIPPIIVSMIGVNEKDYKFLKIRQNLL